MEPALNDSLFDTVDLTLPLFQDIGWSVIAEPTAGIFLDGFEFATVGEGRCQFVQP